MNTQSGLSWKDYMGKPINPIYREFPRNSILSVLYMLKERGGKNIVEIGACRMPLNHPLDELHLECCLDSHSTAYWTKDYLTVSIDIDPQTIANTVDICTALGQEKNLVVWTGDGIAYLKRRMDPIDLLFLDAWDVNLEGSAERHLEAFKAAEQNLHEQSLVLIDDTDVDLVEDILVFADGVSGKGKLVIPYAVNRGWKVVFSGRQTLLSK
jgi:hypothetical protein